MCSRRAVSPAPPSSRSSTAAAFEAGAKPTDTFVDQPVEIPLAGGEVWRPSDEDEPSARAISLRDGARVFEATASPRK